MHRFVPEKVRPILIETLEKELENMEYEPVLCSMQSKSIAQEIKLRVKALNYARFKVSSSTKQNNRGVPLK